MAGRGVKTWRHLRSREPGGVETWRHLPGGVAKLTSKCGVTCPRGVRKPDVASKCGVTGPRGVREPGGVAGRGVPSKCGVTCLRRQGATPALMRVAVAERGVKMWRHLPTWRREPRGVAGRGVKTWRHEAGLPARVFKMCLQSSLKFLGGTS